MIFFPMKAIEQSSLMKIIEVEVVSVDSMYVHTYHECIDTSVKM